MSSDRGLLLVAPLETVKCVLARDDDLIGIDGQGAVVVRTTGNPSRQQNPQISLGQ